MAATVGIGNVSLVLLLMFAGWSGGSAGVRPHQIVASYLQCVNVTSLDLRTMLMFPLIQSELDRPGPSACAKNCSSIDRNYIFFLVHIPVFGQFADKLVCGCGNAKSLDHAPFISDSLCDLPCPLGNGSVVNASQLNSGSPSQEVIDPWLPRRPGEQQQNETTRFFGRKGTVGEVNQRRTYSSTVLTCGNGRGLLSAYQVTLKSSANVNRSLSILLLFLPILSVAL